MIHMNSTTRAALKATFAYALEDPTRLTSFVQKFAYAESWGRTGDRPDPQVDLCTDYGKHSYLFCIRCAVGWNTEQQRVEYEDKPFVLGLYWREETDSWETHS